MLSYASKKEGCSLFISWHKNIPRDYCIVSLTNERRKGGAKMEYKARKQQAKEDVLEYNKNKLNLFLQAYTPGEHNLEQFKDSVLARVLNTELVGGVVAG